MPCVGLVLKNPDSKIRSHFGDNQRNLNKNWVLGDTKELLLIMLGMIKVL
jgi:hypothetical protein